MPRRRWTAAAGLAVAGAVALSACGGDGQAAGPATAAGGASAPGVAADAPSPLPAVNVVDVTSGETVALDSLLPADKPTLVWMWAPH